MGKPYLSHGRLPSLRIAATCGKYTKTQNGKAQKQKLISGDEILPDWRGLTKKEVNQQLRLYGINPSDASWFLDEKSPTYLPVS